MFVYNALQESLKKFGEAVEAFGKVDNITELDTLETQTQKIVFNLQMQANQVAGELAQAFSSKRVELQNAKAADVMAKFHKRQQEIQEKIAGATEKNKVIENEGNDDNVNNNNHDSADNSVGANNSELQREQETERATSADAARDGSTNTEDASALSGSEMPVQEDAEGSEEGKVEDTDERSNDSSDSNSTDSTTQHTKEETKVKDDGDSNRQRKSNTGNRKPKSSKETK